MHCVCDSILGCGSYDESTGMCTSTDGDCATVEPGLTEIECYAQDNDYPSSEGAWARPVGDSENGNCGYGPSAGDSNAYNVRTWYTAKVDSIYSGILSRM